MIAGPVPFSNWREHPEGNHWLIYGSGCYAQDWPSRTLTGKVKEKGKLRDFPNLLNTVYGKWFSSLSAVQVISMSSLFTLSPLQFIELFTT